MKRLLTPASIFSTSPRVLSPSGHLRRYALLGLLALGLTGAPRWAQAQHTHPVSVESADAESIRVRVKNPAQKAGQVQVISLRSGKMLYEEAYNTSAYGHRFSFQGMPAGRYALLLKVGARQYRYVLEVQPDATGSAVAVRTVKARMPKLALASVGL